MKYIDAYEEIEVLKEDGVNRITKVRSTEDSMYYIKREIREGNFDLYSKLMNIHSVHLPGIKYLVRSDSTVILIETYYNAPTLERVLKTQGGISRKQAIDWICQLCDVLELLHKQVPPIIHRDIKPENIFVQQDRLILFDFDIARFYQNNLNTDTQLLGSIGYAAPEQFGFAQSDARTDIYALGIVAKEILGNNAGMYHRVLDKAISMDPKNRYQSVGEMKADLLGKRWILPGILDENKRDKIFSWGFIVAGIFFALIMENVDYTQQIFFKLTVFLYFYGIPLLWYNRFHFTRNKYMQVVFSIVLYIVWIYFCTFLAMVGYALIGYPMF